MQLQPAAAVRQAVWSACGGESWPAERCDFAALWDGLPTALQVCGHTRAEFNKMQHCLLLAVVSRCWMKLTLTS